MLLGNDIAGKRVVPELEMIENPWDEKELEADPELIAVGKDGSEEVEECKIFPACFVTRPMIDR